MRATLDLDPTRGPGYAILTIHGIGEQSLANPALKRISDGLQLGPGGWQKSPSELPVEDRQWSDSALLLFLSPDVTDNLSPDQHYQIEIPGFGNCPLQIVKLMQSRIIYDNGQEIYPPENTGTSSNSPEVPEIIIHEGVESSPYENHDIQSANSEETIKALENPKKGNKRGGCVFLALFGLAVWLSGAWLLWHGSMSGQEKTQISTTQHEEDNEGRPFFEIIPGATDSSVVEMDEDEDKEKKPAKH